MVSRSGDRKHIYFLLALVKSTQSTVNTHKVSFIYCFSVSRMSVKAVFNGHLNIPEKLSQHDRCPFIAGSLTWGR